MVDAISLLTAGGYGLIGAVVYILANNLFNASQYLSALEHLVAGFVVGILAVLVFGFSAPTALTDATPFVAFGYASLDIVQLVASSLAARAASQAGGLVPPASGTAPAVAAPASH